MSADVRRDPGRDLGRGTVGHLVGVEAEAVVDLGQHQVLLGEDGVSFSRKISGSSRSCTRMPTRLALSAYAGPMPRLVVPSLFLPRCRSISRSSSWWYGRIRWALPDTFSREQSTPLGLERVDLGEQHDRVDHDAVADDRRDVVVQHARRHELEGERLAVDHQGVAGVVAALVADDHRHLLGDEVGQLALALVAPLGAHHDRRRHPLLLRQVPRSIAREFGSSGGRDSVPVGRRPTTNAFAGAHRPPSW